MPNYKQHIELYGEVEGKRLWVELTTAKRVTSGFAAMPKKQRTQIATNGARKRWEKYEAEKK